MAVHGRPLSTPDLDLDWGRVANHRGAGLVNLVDAMIGDRLHHASGERATHVLDVLERILVS